MEGTVTPVARDKNNDIVVDVQGRRDAYNRVHVSGDPYTYRVSNGSIANALAGTVHDVDIYTSCGRVSIPLTAAEIDAILAFEKQTRPAPNSVKIPEWYSWRGLTFEQEFERDDSEF